MMSLTGFSLQKNTSVSLKMAEQFFKRLAPSSIIIKRRVRLDIGDITPLMESLKKYGQLSPIIVNSNNELIAGERRLAAAKRLGWPAINAMVLERNSELDKLQIEVEENIQRSNFTMEEMQEAFTRLDKLSKPNLLKRIIAFFKKLFNRIFKGD